jgi:dsDNA-binding SOS-regulon protein
MKLVFSSIRKGTNEKVALFMKKHIAAQWDKLINEAKIIYLQIVVY